MCPIRSMTQRDEVIHGHPRRPLIVHRDPAGRPFDLSVEGDEGTPIDALARRVVQVGVRREDAVDPPSRTSRS